jgi:hypothetical protein
VTLVRNDVSEELSASLIRGTRIGELGTKLAITSNRCMLRRNDLAFLRSVQGIKMHAKVQLEKKKGRKDEGDLGVNTKVNISL